jgi:putative transposase
MKTGKRLDLLRLSKIGDIPIRVHRAVESEIKQVTVKRQNSGKWFACICVEKEACVTQREPEGCRHRCGNKAFSNRHRWKAN